MDELEVESVLRLAATKLNQPCNIWRETTTLPRADGWILCGMIEVIATRKTYQVYFHPVKQRGWLWGMRRTNDGVVARDFNPPEERREPAFLSGTAWKRAKRLAEDQGHHH